MAQVFAFLSMAALMAACLALAINYNDLITPNLETFEAAIKHATETVEPPRMKLGKNAVLDKVMEAYEYKQLAKNYQETQDVGKRTYMLTIEILAPLRVLVVEEVLKYVKAGLESHSDEESRVILKAECQNLQREARSAIREASEALDDVEKRIAYFKNTDKDVLRVVNLARFCPFL